MSARESSLDRQCNDEWIVLGSSLAQSSKTLSEVSYYIIAARGSVGATSGLDMLSRLLKRLHANRMKCCK